MTEAAEACEQALNWPGAVAIVAVAVAGAFILWAMFRYSE